MTAGEAQVLDAGLPGGEQQVEARVTLCGYLRGVGTGAEAAAALSRHVAWLTTSWLPELPLERRNPAETEDALAFFQQIDPDLALAGLERARGTIPGTRWWRVRGDLLLGKARAPGADHRGIALDAHEAYLRGWRAWLSDLDRDRKQFEADSDRPRRERLLHALELSTPFTRMRLLTQLLEASFEAELGDEAAAHAAELEALMVGPVASIAAEARHRVEIARGRLALRRKDDCAATIHLMDSTAQLGQALSLRYSGPDLKLAEELMAQGHRSTVIEFLERCEEASAGLCPRLTEIRRAVEQGDEPDWTPVHAPRAER